MAGFMDAFNKAGIKVTDSGNDNRYENNRPNRNRPNNNRPNNNRNGNNRNNNYGQNRGYGGGEQSTYVGAPYNFVPFYKDVVSVEKTQLLTHGDLKENLLSGEINYTMTAQTPVFIDDGTDEHNFSKNENGDYAIPGSSIRGLIRNNVQILGLSGFDEDIDDYTLLFRNVASGPKSEKKRYAEILGAKQIPFGKSGNTIGVLTKVRAGYIKKEGSKYYIYQTVVDELSKTFDKMNYYVISERTIFDNKSDYPYCRNHPEYLQNDIRIPFRAEEKRNGTHYIGRKNANYRAGYHSVSYNVANIKNITRIDEPGFCQNEGVLVCTGFMNEKKALYIIPEIDTSKERIEIEEKDVKAYKIDFEKRKNVLAANKDYYALPKDGEEKPVFYIYEGGHLYFGSTPRLRLFYDHNIKDGYKQRKVAFDYAKSIFGTIDEKSGYKSKVSFTDAKAYSAVVGPENKVILGEPKVSSYFDYLKQNSADPVTYNSSDFELRGVKQYWLHKDIVKQEIKEDKEKVTSKLHPLVKGTVFKGVIRYQNLTAAELGLLIWSLKLEDHSWMNIGKAKAFGFGAVKVSDVSVKSIDLEEAYGLDTLSLDPFTTLDADTYIEAYQKEMSKKLSGKIVRNLPHIKTFFDMKDSTIMPDEEKIRFMSIDNREYQNRKKPLQTVDQLVNK